MPNGTSVSQSETMQHSKALNRAVAVGAAIMVVIGLVLLSLLLQATNNRDLNEQNYTQLFTINLVVAGILLVSIVGVGWRLFVRLRQGRFGSRLLVKLAVIFALVGVAPGALIYVVSYNFVKLSIESWFDVKVEGALEAGLNLGRVTLDTLSNDLAAKSRNASAQLTESPNELMGIVLERVQEQLGATNVAVWTASGNLVASAGQARFQLSPDRPTPSQFRTARTERSVAWVEGLEEVTLESTVPARIKVLVPIASNALGLTPELRYLLVSRALPANLVANALAVEGANREYQERALAREGLKTMYIGTLTLSLFLAVFGAVLLAVVLGNQIARPLLLLAEGVSQVAAGDFRPKIAMQGKDELGGLTRAFASMTEQLSGARQAVENSMAEVDAARANLQTILDNLTAGVMVLGPDGVIRSSNPGATRILKIPVASYEGVQLSDIEGLHAFGEGVQAQFVELTTQRMERGMDHWQQSFELGANANLAQGPFERSLTLVARGAELPGDARLLVFDDISEIVSAQRAQAWGEVARRLAHEIKNPLTPIQLSAERLEKRLGGKLEAPEQQVLTKSVKTIVDQVDAMKRLVNEFRDYARLPAADLKPVDLNALVQDVMQLYDSESSTVPVRLELQADCPPIMGDAEQLRQVIHNLLQNAQDATETATAALPPLPIDAEQDRSVIVRTQWREGSARARLSVLDRGTGFPDQILKRAFEPYVTTKVRGTGLGLAVVKKIADEHGARCDISNRTEDGQVVGAQVSLSLAIDSSAGLSVL